MTKYGEMLIIDAKLVETFLKGRESFLIDLVERVYRAHHAGNTVCPDSYFLRFPDAPRDRIIALPSYINDQTCVSGIKWISSFPENVDHGLQRASAVIVLNNTDNGYAYAFIEASRISAARTAASASLAVRVLHGAPTSIGVVGSGPIAQTTLHFIKSLYTTAVPVKIHDLNSELVARIVTRHGPECSVVSLEEALGCDLVLLATSAGTPYVPMSVRFQPNQLVLNISLRDLHPETIRTANNVFDDVEHCLKANTTPHLLEKLNGNRNFITGTLAEFICSEKQLDPDHPTVFSPFGLGILDLAVAQSLYEHVQISGDGLRVPDFHGDMKR